MGSTGMIDSLAHRRGRPAGADEAACTFGAGALHSSMAGSPPNAIHATKGALSNSFKTMTCTLYSSDHEKMDQFHIGTSHA